MDASSTATSPDGLSWATAYKNLQMAINAAQPGDCLWIAAGRYFTSGTGDRSNSFSIGKSISLYGGFDGSETCLAQRAGNYSGTRLSGDIGTPGTATDNAYQVVSVVGPAPFGQTIEVLIDGLNIRDAYNDAGAGDGGGIYADLIDRLEIRNCIIRNNVAAGDGGGLLLKGVDSLYLSQCQFISNAAGDDGGALWITNLNGDSYVYNTVFKNNTADGKGGAFYIQQNPPLVSPSVYFMNGLFHGNSANKGGAGYLAEGFSGGHGGQADLTNCTVASNSVSTSGAAFEVEESGSFPACLTLTNCVVWGNTGGGAGSLAVIKATNAPPNGCSFVWHSIVEPAGSYWDASAGSCTPFPSTNFSCNPSFVGTTFRLSSSSPAIDWGNSDVIPPDFFDYDADDDTTEKVPWDLDGNDRIQGTPPAVDLGCYEAQ